MSDAEFETSKPKSIGSTCKIKLLEKRYQDGKFETIAKKDGFCPSTDHQDYALVSKLSFNEKNQHLKTTLTINAPTLLRALRKVVTYYPSYDLSFKDPLKIKSPFMLLGHHIKEFIQYEKTLSDEIDKANLKLLLDYLHNDKSITASEKVISNGLISFSLLWILFKPGSLVLKEDGEHGLRLFWLENVTYEGSFIGGDYLKLDCFYTDSDGTRDGMARESLKIAENEFPGTGTMKINSLFIQPLHCHSNSTKLKKNLSARGKLFLEMQKMQVMRYDGSFEALRQPSESFYSSIARDFSGVWIPQTTTGRVVVDTSTFIDENKSFKNSIIPWEKTEVSGMLNDTLMLCPPLVYGYSLELRCWCKFFIDLLKAVPWNCNAYDNLVLGDSQKSLIRALVSAHRFKTFQVRDELALKGKGLVILLHGSPGTGKTLTAETVAEGKKRPLLIIPTGELGSELQSIQIALKRLIRYATIWRAVILIDEADVFLEARQSGASNTLEKNALVAVFLRQLEYFQGTIFLTSNRAQTFDPAVKSRVHLTLRFSPTDVKTRRLIWRKKLTLHLTEEGGLDIEKIISMVEGYELDGREISNVVNLAETLAGDQATELGEEHFMVILKMWEESKSIGQGPDHGTHEHSRATILRMRQQLSLWVAILVLLVLYSSMYYRQKQCLKA